MLTDNVITLSSPWCFENILLKDVSPDSWNYSPEKQTNDNEVYSHPDCHVERTNNFHDYCAIGNLSTGTSIASSECSDDIYLDLDNETDNDLFGDLASSVMNILHDIHESDDVLDNDITSDLSCDSPVDLYNSEPPSIDLSCRDCTNCRQKPHRKQKDKKWDHLTEDEKAVIVDQISLNISRNLGLREQLEVIRIINPKSSVSPTDGQFLIDITNMTEEKIQKIQDYIKTHSCRECVSDDSISNSSPRKSKKKQSQERKNRHRVDKQRQRKEYRQILKEKRSGLFVKEEVLSMSRLSPPPDDGEDIDILG